MSKKRFSDGLDDLLSNMEAYEEPKQEQEMADVAVQPKKKKRSKGRKNFISDLDFLLQEAVNEMEDGSDDYGYARSGQPSGKQAAPGKSKSRSSRSSSNTSKGPRAPLTGLDALIRQTVKVNHYDEPTKKRLTVTVEKEMLKRLKTIARMENQFLKDIMARLIDEYIEEYKDNKGIDL